MNRLLRVLHPPYPLSHFPFQWVPGSIPCPPDCPWPPRFPVVSIASPAAQISRKAVRRSNIALRIARTKLFSIRKDLLHFVIAVSWRRSSIIKDYTTGQPRWKGRFKALGSFSAWFLRLTQWIAHPKMLLSVSFHYISFFLLTVSS